MRQRGIIELAIDSLVNLYQTRALTDHSTGNSLESDVEKTNIACAIKAVKVHTGYKNINSPSTVPLLEAIWANNDSVQESVMSFVHTLFMVSVLVFKSRGELCPVLEICAASSIQYYPDVTKDCGTANIISSTLSKVARKVNLLDVQCVNRSPEYVLNYWFKLIKDNL